MPTYTVAARRVRTRSDRPLPPWHAADLLDEDPAAQAGEDAVSLCGVPGLRLFPIRWEGPIAGNRCPLCRVRARFRYRPAPASVG